MYLLRKDKENIHYYSMDYISWISNSISTKYFFHLVLMDVLVPGGMGGPRRTPVRAH
jgi:hypothetical protein